MHSKFSTPHTPHTSHTSHTPHPTPFHHAPHPTPYLLLAALPTPYSAPNIA
ncbi:MAG: hypothetical protein ACRCZS_19480 [Chroococcidiopsis sp.]